MWPNRIVRVSVLAVMVLLAQRALPAQFIRGDANSDGAISMDDFVNIISYLGSGTAPPVDCSSVVDFDAGDVNDNEFVNWTDALYLASVLLVPLTPAIPPPTASCGVDPTTSTGGFDVPDPLFELRSRIGLTATEVVVRLELSHSQDVAIGTILVQFDQASVVPQSRPFVPSPGLPDNDFDATVVDGDLVLVHFGSLAWSPSLPASSSSHLGELRFDRTGVPLDCSIPPITLLANTVQASTGVAWRTTMATTDFQDHQPTLVSECTDYSLAITDGSSNAGESVELSVLLTGTAGELPIQAWSFGVGFGPELILEEVAFGIDALTAQCGDAPDLLSIAEVSGGVTFAAVVDSFGVCTLSPGPDLELAALTLLTPTSGDHAVCFSDGLGSPPVATMLVVEPLAGIVPAQHCGTVTVSDNPAFLRGDCDRDGAFAFGDAFQVLNAVFVSTPMCSDACDVNDDGAVDISDVLYCLTAILLDGPEPPTPFPNCDPDGTLDSLTCTDPGPC